MAFKILGAPPAFQVVADGVGRSVTVDLTDPPLNLDLKANKPIAVADGTIAQDNTDSVTLTVESATMQGTKVTVTLVETVASGHKIAIGLGDLVFNAAG